MIRCCNISTRHATMTNMVLAGLSSMRLGPLASG